MRLVVATQNQGKLKEIKEVLKGIELEVVSLNELTKKFRIRETGKTFLENAIKKTLPVSKFYSDDFIVGEDSGIEVSFLNNKPGVYSKRYSGRNSTDLKNNQRILQEMQEANGCQRNCRFRCVLVLMQAGKLLQAFEGTLQGLINREIAGNNGFGYDPIFYLPAYQKTVAQLSLREKNKISHRAYAFKQLRRYLFNKL
jgi:XTP/dITP diphosphohydrolase